MSRSQYISLCVAGMLVSALTSHAVIESDYAIYQRDIVDRQPFGAPPPVAVPAPVAKVQPPPPTRPSVLKDLVLVAITESAGGVRVGFINKRTKKPYYMAAGDPPEDGIQVVEVYLREDKAILEYEGAQETLLLPGASASASFLTGPSAASASASGDIADAGTQPKTKPYRSRIHERQKALEERRKARAEEQARMTREKGFMEYLKAYQMDLIRAGGEKGPPLPMQLTPEMDKQLVQEGVLPELE